MGPRMARRLARRRHQWGDRLRQQRSRYENTGAALQTLATPSSVRGGKYSKEMNGWSVAAVHALTMSMILQAEMVTGSASCKKGLVQAVVRPCCATHLPFLITGSTPRLSVPLPETSAASVAVAAR